MPAGRKTKRTPEVEQKICDLLRAGVPRKDAALSAGISEDSLGRWQKNFADFADAIARAESDCVSRNVATIQRAASGFDTATTRTKNGVILKKKKTTHPDGTIVEEEFPVPYTEVVVTTGREFDWRAGAWWLERRRPDDFKERKEQDNTGTVNIVAAAAVSLKQKLIPAVRPDDTGSTD